MNHLSNFPSLHEKRYECNGEKLSIFQIGQSLSRQELKRVLAALSAEGYTIRKLDFFEYGSSDTLRHLFITSQQYTSPTPYFLLDPDEWQAIVRIILSVKRQGLPTIAKKRETGKM